MSVLEGIRGALSQPTPLDWLDADELFSLLGNRRRRLAIRELADAQQPVDLGDLSRAVAAAELDKPREGVTTRERKRVYTALYQTHLPKLYRYDLVDYRTAGDALPNGPIRPVMGLDAVADEIERVAGLTGGGC